MLIRVRGREWRSVLIACCDCGSAARMVKESWLASLCVALLNRLALAAIPGALCASKHTILLPNTHTHMPHPLPAVKLYVPVSLE